MNGLIERIDSLRCTELGVLRVSKNLGIDAQDAVEWCRKRILDKDTVILRRGKNWYAFCGDSVITVNAGSNTVITAHKVTKK